MRLAIEEKFIESSKDCRFRSTENPAKRYERDLLLQNRTSSVSSKLQCLNKASLWPLRAHCELSWQETYQNLIFMV